MNAAVVTGEMPEPSLRRIALVALLTVLFGFGGLGAWAFTARLDRAVLASGTVVVQGKRKTISLLESGILKEMLVREGQRVALGQPLLRLDDTQASAAAGQARARLWAASARVARLRAEQEGAAQVAFPADLLATALADASVAGFVEAERQLFAARWRSLDGTVQVLERRILQGRAQIESLVAQARASAVQSSLTQDELQGVNRLLAAGFATRTRAMELQRRDAELRGALALLNGREAEAREAIAQAEAEIVSLRQTRLAETAGSLQETRAQFAEAAERMRAAEDLLARAVVAAPEDGVVSDVRFVTPGGTIGAGQPVLDIVPQEDLLVIEAQVSPYDAEGLHPGQPANVRLSAFNARRVPPVPGRLTYVSADRQLNQQGEPLFLVRVLLDAEALEGLRLPTVLTPGMPAEVHIIRGERRAIDYLASPLLDAMRRSMRGG